MPTPKQIILADIESYKAIQSDTEKTLKRLKKELKEHTLSPLKLDDGDGDFYTAMNIDEEGGVDVDICYLELKDVPAVIQWLTQAIGEEK